MGILGRFRKKLRSKKLELDLYRQLIEKASDGIHILDQSGNVVHCSLIFADLLGYSFEEAMKLNVRDWDRLFPVEELGPIVKDLIHNPRIFETKHLRKNGELLDVEINARGIELDGKIYLYASSRDITKNKKLRLENEKNLAKINSVFDAIPDGLFVVNSHGIIEDLNTKACEIFNYKKEELLNQNIKILMDDPHHSNHDNYISDYLRTGISKIIGRPRELEAKGKNGEVIPISLSISEVKMDGGPSFTGVIRDISEKKYFEEQLREREVKFRTIFERSPDAYLIMTTTNGEIIDCNVAAQDILRGEKKQILGLSPNILSPETQPDGTLSSLGAKEKIEFVIQNGHHRFEWYHRRLDGEVFPCDVNVSLLNYGKESVFFVSWRDISQNKEQERKLIEAKEKAEVAEHSRAQFLANMSHEIRTPMNGILGMTELLIDKCADTESMENLKIIKNSGEILLGLINDILDFSKFEAGKISIDNHNFNLLTIMKDIQGLFSHSASEKGLSLIFDIDHSVPNFIVSDQLRIKQVINNLLSNALKFTKKGKIELSLRSQSQNDKIVELKFSIRDSGIGIEPESIEKLFKDFSQVDESTTRIYGGTGLGLSISKKIVEMLGGEIHVRSEIGKGSEFSFTIFCEIGNQIVEENNTVGRNWRFDSGLSVLVVEDNLINQKVIGGLLKKIGTKPDFANNGVEALVAVDKKKYDLVFMDGHMPFMDGFQTTKKIIEKYGNSRPIIIAITASAMKEDIEKCFNSGMDDFISKPVSKESIEMMLAKYFQSKISKIG